MNPLLQQARSFSPYLARQIDSGRLTDLPKYLDRPWQPADFVDFADWQNLSEPDLMRQLRLLRALVVAQIMVRDLCHLADLNEVTHGITHFADFAVRVAVDFAHRWAVQMYGEPIGQHTQSHQYLSVVAMGKAGGFELNVSSDIDLIFVYPEAGETNGKRQRSNQEFFTKVGQKVIALLNDVTADGWVFRVDMRLRPDGDSGALVLSETALENYLIQHGREWERYAWCKARVVTPYANGIQALVRPFVFRKYLDYNAYEGMRGLHQQIRQEVQKRTMADNIKLGAGGIREVEFIAQIFQMIRGGQMRVLQLKGTQETLLQLAKWRILGGATVEKLLSAYRFLRMVEHRLQYWEDQQTQILPHQAEQQTQLAISMQFTDYEQFLQALNQHRQFVDKVFNQILQQPEEHGVEQQHHLVSLWQGVWDDAEHIQKLSQLGFSEANELHQRMKQLRHSRRYRDLSALAQARFDGLVAHLIESSAQTDKPTPTLNRLLDFLEAICKRSVYLAFLQEYPQALQNLVQLMSQSSWLADYLKHHPILLDELLSAQLMEQADWQGLQHDLAHALAGAEDVEDKMNVLRQFQHAQTFRLAVQDLGGLWTVEALSDELSLLADTILRHALDEVWRTLPKKSLTQMKFAIMAYGKLGGKELGYASDLDLIFLYDDDPDTASEYIKLARRLMTWLTSVSSSGRLYEVDLRLRPEGDSGLVVHSIQAFEKYQHQSAQTWEHQALTRARFICGDEAIGKRFEQIRRCILQTPRDEQQLCQQVIEMREKMFITHPADDNHVKYARGGVVDVEFIVQYLVLAQSRVCPELLENYGNIALLKMASDRKLIAPSEAERMAQAYRYYRQIQHNKKLRDAQRVQVNDELLVHYAVVKRVWGKILGQEL